MFIKVKYLIPHIFTTKIFAQSKIYAYICIAMLRMTALQGEYTYQEYYVKSQSASTNILKIRKRRHFGLWIFLFIPSTNYRYCRFQL